MGIENFLTDRDNEIDAYDRYEELGNGRYALVPKKHIWRERNRIGTFLAILEVVESTPISDGLAGYSASPVGSLRTIKMWGFGNDKTHNRCMGQLKQYLSQVLSRSATEKRDWKGDAAKLVAHAENPQVIAQLGEARVNCEAIVRAATSAEGQPWRFVAYM